MDSELRDDPNPRTVLVTGASGFVGRNVCAILAAKGYSIRAVIRERSPFGGEGVTAVIYHGLDDSAGRRCAMRGASTVVHLAGRAHVLNNNDAASSCAFFKTNVDGTLAVLREAITAGVTTFVHLSSIGAVKSLANEPISELTPPEPRTPYAVSKLQSERVVREMCAENRIDYAILRPPLVYGPGMKGNPLRLFDAVFRGLPLPIASAKNRRSVLFVGNLASAIDAILRKESPFKETYNVGEGPAVSTLEFVQLIGNALKTRPRLLNLPDELTRAAGRVGDIVSRFVPFPITSYTIDQLFGSLELDFSRLQSSTRYVPEFSMVDGLLATANWYLTTQSRKT